ncbi:hypothetical protein [Sphingobacterium detergens]
MNFSKSKWCYYRKLTSWKGIYSVMSLGLVEMETVLDDKDKKEEENSPSPEQILTNQEKEVRDES